MLNDNLLLFTVLTFSFYTDLSNNSKETTSMQGPDSPERSRRMITAGLPFLTLTPS